MTRKEYRVEINANAEVVWHVLWDREHYYRWAGVFCDGADYLTNELKEGNKVRFININGDGIHSVVGECKPLERMSFVHIGKIRLFEEEFVDEETPHWTGGKETYILSESNGVTTLVVELDAYEKFLEFFDTVFPKALEKIKEMAEEFYFIIRVDMRKGVDLVWEKWVDPTEVKRWFVKGRYWRVTKAENDLRMKGKFRYRMETRDKSEVYEYTGTYIMVERNKFVVYNTSDGRKVYVIFVMKGTETSVVEFFEPDKNVSLMQQYEERQLFLNKFKEYVK